MSGIVDQARDLPPEMVGILGAITAFLAVLAIAVQLTVRQLRLELQGAQEELVDRATGLLPRSAVRVRLGAEVAWAAASRTPIAVAVLRIRGSRFVQAAHVLRHAMREEEGAFLLGDQHVAVELWGVDADAAIAATRRLGEDLAAAGHPVVDAGIACSPRDGSDIETLLTIARRDLRPIEDPRPDTDDADRVGRLPGRIRHAFLVLVSALPALFAMSALLLLAWRLVPAAVEPGFDAGGRSTNELIVALVTLIGLPAGAALLHATCWNLGWGRLPGSRPASQAGWRPAAIVALVVAVPLAWAVHAPTSPDTISPAFGATLAILALVVLAVLHARQLVHAPIVALAPIVAAGAAIAWFAVEVLAHPVIANGGRLLFAVALGAVLARLVERASWMVLLAVLAGGIDAWSVSAETGVSRRLLESGADDADRLVDLLLFVGPAIGDVPPLEFGVTDLVFLALFLAWSHDWRLDMRVVAGALLVAAWAAVAWVEFTDEVVPMLSFLAAAMVFVLFIRSLVLRARATAWSRTAQEHPAVSETGSPRAG